MNVKFLKMTTGKRKILSGCDNIVVVEEKGKWPYGMCRIGVSNDSVLCIQWRRQDFMTGGAQVWRRKKTKKINLCLTTPCSTLYTPEYASLH